MEYESPAGDKISICNTEKEKLAELTNKLTRTKQHIKPSSNIYL
jgi:hypothetical protein